MINVLRGTLTRRLFLIFLGLALVPTILLLIVPALFQIQSEQERIANLQLQLEDWAGDIFTRLSESKADNYFQALEPRMTTFELFSSQIAQIPISEWENNFFIDSTIQQLIKRDNAICQVAVQEFEDNFQELIDGIQYKSKSLSLDDGLYLMIPIQHNTSLIGILKVDFCVEYLINLVPQFGLAENATMLLVDSFLNIIGIPQWGQSSTLLMDFNVQNSHMNTTNFPELIGEKFYDYMLNHNFNTYLQTKTTFVIPVDVDDQQFFIAGSPVSETSLWVLLLLPREAIFNQAELYGANLAVSIPAIITQALLSVIGFLLVISFGAMFSLKSVAKPIQQLSTGARKVSKGDLENHVPEDGPGEMKELAISFNQMVNAIKDYRDSLKEKQMELESNLEKRDQEFKQINQTAELITLGGGLAEKLSKTLDIIQNVYEYDIGVIYLVGENEFLLLAAQRIENSMGLDMNQVRQFASTAIESQAEFELYKDLGVNGIGSAAVYPIRFRKEIIGILVMQWSKDCHLDDSQQAFLNALTKQIAVIIENFRLQNQERNLLIAEERNHLARELHDSISQSLFSLSMIAEGLQVKQKDMENSKEKAQALDLLVSHAKKIRIDLKEMIAEMRPVSQTGNDIEEIVKGHLNRLKRITSIQTTSVIDLSSSSIPNAFIQNIDRIIQEALSNIARHSQAEHVEISLTYKNKILSLVITDDGTGFDILEKMHKRDSFGLMNMRERAELLGGTFHVDSSQENGTSIKISFPI